MVLNTEIFIERAKEIHSDKYDYSQTVYVKSREKCIIICKKHGPFEQTPNKHLCGRGCAKCAVENKITRPNTHKKSTEEYIDQAKEIHITEYDYSKVIYDGCKKNVIVICPIHGEFSIRADHLLLGRGCQKCGRIEGGRKISQTQKKPQEQFIQECIDKHGDIFDYSLVEYKNTDTNVKIICKEKGHTFSIRPDHFLNGTGCAYCSGRKTCKDNCVATTHPELLKEWDFEMNAISPEEITAHSKWKIYWICQENPEHRWKTMIAHRTDENQPTGCPNCSFGKKYSQKAIDWLEYMMEKENIFIQHAENGGEYKLKSDNDGCYLFDGYCAETNMVYEFYGCEFHGCPKCKSFEEDEENYSRLCKDTYYNLYCKTLGREDFIKSKGFNLKFIYECEWDELQESL